MGSVSQLLAKHSVQARRGRVDIHRDQGIVEHFNRTLVAERLFGHQYAQEMRLPFGERSTEWVKRLPSVVALNGEVTRLTDKKPSNAIKAKTLTQKPSFVVPGRPLGLKEQKVPSESVFAIFTGQVKWRVVSGGPLTWCGLLKCTSWDVRWPSPTSPCCTTCRVTMPHCEALFEKSCLRCYPTHSYHRMRSSGFEQLLNVSIFSRAGMTSRIPVAICHRVQPIFCDPALGVKGWESDLVQMSPVDAMALWLQDIHAMAKGLLFEEGLFVLHVSDELLHDILFYTLSLLGLSFFRRPQWLSTSWAQANILCACSAGALVFQLSQNLLVGWAVQRVVLV